ncbi:hypothetical protein A2950_00835 [Candidatus Kaiserbacteria bacterium RIFCSPLOWO2_01_FULL_55_19]|uniref:Uncharacterized protein n=1 Tax=Candidatus Kaiserbacteria bacterium RIFCSPLOWO2_01_FULL_55_19 TaxID=1798516 RepID=A0A1F6ES33_9BACT|nr:MAG: hypothetical protein A2950_00835 [Candidatus Kaiserbacteria bacterium RIFCSPLOWO2_01_FULL_55_19]
MNKIFQRTALITAFATPLLAFAQSGINTSYLTPYSTGIIGVVNNILVPVLMAIAFIVFLWGVYKYFILGAADEKSRTEGRHFSLWGIIGFIIILSMWGLVNLLMGTFGLQAGVASPPPPTFGTGNYAPTGGGGAFGAGNVTPAQNAALTQQYQTMQSTCLSNPTSPDCQAAQAAYSSSYYSVYPNPNATITNAQTTTVGAGADCTYSPCASGLTCEYDSLGYGVCSSGTTAGYGSGTAACTPPQVQSPEGGCYTPSEPTPSDYTIQNCESTGGYWDGFTCDYSGG